MENQEHRENEGMSYFHYLNGDHWKKVRREAIKRAGNRCQVCGSRIKLEVHHNTYENIGGEKPEDLCVLCFSCHDLFSNRIPRGAVEPEKPRVLKNPWKSSKPEIDNPTQEIKKLKPGWRPG